MSAVREEGSPATLPAPPEQPARAAPMPVSHQASLPLAETPRGFAGWPARVSRTILPYVSHQLQYVGRTGVVGVALLVCGVVGFLSANLAMRSHVAELQSNLASANHAHAASGANAIRDLTPAARVKTLMSKLPNRGDLPAITEQIVAQADAAGLSLERGSYAIDVVRSGQIVRARLTFPVHGTYPAIRRFVDGTLATVGGAAVDGLRLERKEIATAEINADIRFAVYLRNSP